jgi:heme-degrading monooxygenase HmoA
MYLIIWQYRVCRGKEAEFERAYGPDGDWARLFRTDPGFIGTTLLRDLSDASCFTTIDRWASPSAFERFMSDAGRRYEELDRRFEPLTDKETRLLSVDVPADPPARDLPKH